MKFFRLWTLLLSALIADFVDAWRLLRGMATKRQRLRVARRYESLLFARMGLRQRMRMEELSFAATRKVHKTAYWGTMQLGTPAQNFRVIFDTGSGNLIIPGSSCNVAGCQPHQKYNSNKSHTSHAILNERGEGSSDISFGTGQISGNFFQDKLCIGETVCIDSANFIAAVRETEEPFKDVPFDGIMGLGFKDLSMGDGFNIVDDLVGKGALPGGQFSFYLTDDGNSEVTFGGFKPENVASDVVWAAVKHESYWQVAIDDIAFDNVPKGLCEGNCQVAVDTGTSMLAGPTDLVEKLSDIVDAKPDCSNFGNLPLLGFKIGDKILNLRPDDYMDRSASDCSFSLMALDVPPPRGPLFIFGDPFLRRFLTVYDRHGPRVGFAVAKHQDDNVEQAAAELIYTINSGGAPPSASSFATGQSRLAGENPGAVDLPLDSGMMATTGEADSDQSDSGNKDTEPASTAGDQSTLAAAAQDSNAQNGNSAASSTASPQQPQTTPMSDWQKMASEFASRDSLYEDSGAAAGSARQKTEGTEAVTLVTTAAPAAVSAPTESPPADLAAQDAASIDKATAAAVAEASQAASQVEEGSFVSAADNAVGRMDRLEQEDAFLQKNEKRVEVRHAQAPKLVSLKLYKGASPM